MSNMQSHSQPFTQLIDKPFISIGFLTTTRNKATESAPPLNATNTLSCKVKSCFSSIYF